MKTTAELLFKRYENKEVTVEEVAKEVLAQIAASDLNCYVTVDEDRVLERARALDAKFAAGESLGALFGLPISVKDNISTKGLRTTCSSKMLEDYVPVYDATVVTKIEEADGLIIGKTNMDEFAMGSSSETSYFGPTKNPLNPTLIPGGSSSGSAASVAAGDVVLSLGTDTGGSVRQPASYCNVVGYYPTYGTISRYGVVSMANTLDQVAILGKNVDDVRRMTNVIGGNDPKDMTSVAKGYLDFKRKNDDALTGMVIGYPADMGPYNIEEEVAKDFETALDRLRELGAKVVEVPFTYLKYANPTYNVIVTSEVSSNMSRFDGIRYGYRTEHYDTTEELYVKTRSEGFGEEVQRRIAMGTHYLGAENDQLIYKQGLRMRSLIRDEFNAHFETLDFIATPTTTNLPYPIGERLDDAMSMYDSGAFDVPVNLAGLCAISVPVREGISGSLQLIGRAYDDERLLNCASCFERSHR